MHVGSVARRDPNLWRPTPSLPRAATPATWRCPNPACGVWVQPSKAREPDTCHACDTARPEPTR